MEDSKSYSTFDRTIVYETAWKYPASVSGELFVFYRCRNICAFANTDDFGSIGCAIRTVRFAGVREA